MIDQRGTASGWSAYLHNGIWHWRAYGPNGSAGSTAATESDAKAKAQAAVEHLKRVPR